MNASKLKIATLFMTLAFILPVSLVSGQNRNGAYGGGHIYEKKHVENKRTPAYPHIREADIMWSKTVWRIIDFREKKNLMLYYPTRVYENEGGYSLRRLDKRRNLVQVLYDAARPVPDSGRSPLDNGQRISVYDPFGTTEFQIEFQDTIDFLRTLDALPDTSMVPDPNTGNMIQKIVPPELKTEDIKQLLVKELWFFDKQRSTLDVRIIGLCPIRIYYHPVTGNLTIEEAFWVYYPEARQILANAPVYFPENDANELSFADVFEKRLFSSYIVRESNTYDNRSIMQYTEGKESLYEAKRIEEKIFNFEQDLWSY